MEERVCICIVKSYYASVECIARGFDPLKTNLPVADETRFDQTIFLAVSPTLKAIGVPALPCLFEARQAIRLYDAAHGTKNRYYVALPRIAEYERISARIFSIYIHYLAPEDIHVYSINEAFHDCSRHLYRYAAGAEKHKISPVHLLAKRIVRETLEKTGITATVGIGSNLYLAKMAMDSVAKKARPDSNGMRLAELDERRDDLPLRIVPHGEHIS